MLLTFFLQLFFLQLIIFGIIIFTLTVILNHQLIEEAVTKFRILLEKNPQLKWQEIALTTARVPNDSLTTRIKECAAKAWGKNPVIHSRIDPKMRGGVIIEMGDQRIDFSLRTRLRDSGIWK